MRGNQVLKSCPSTGTSLLMAPIFWKNTMRCRRGAGRQTSRGGVCVSGLCVSVSVCSTARKKGKTAGLGNTCADKGLQMARAATATVPAPPSTHNVLRLLAPSTHTCPHPPMRPPTCPPLATSFMRMTCRKLKQRGAAKRAIWELLSSRE